MRFSAFLLLLCAAGLAAPAAAAGTETFTPTMTDSPTVTASPTVTPGAGNWSLSIANPLIYGGAGNTAVWTYFAAETFSNGLLAFQLPAGLEAPSGSNFFVQPSQAGQVSATGYNGQSVSVTVSTLPAGSSLVFWYGFNANGFAVNTASTPLGPFTVWAHPSSTVAGAGVVTPVPAPAPIAIVTRTVTPTVTPTATITVTSTPSPTITQTRTITQTFTETPVAAAPVSGVFAYPNPFDLRRFDKVTFRFQPTASASVQVFNLAGEPVRTLDAGDVFANLGWALWHGEDDHRRRVTGGLYFVRVKTADGVLTRKFTVLH